MQPDQEPFQRPLNHADLLFDAKPLLLPLPDLLDSVLLVFLKKNFQLQLAPGGMSKKDKLQMGVTRKLQIYFKKRYFFFQKFDKGIQMDSQSWYSVIAEPISKALLSHLIHDHHFAGTIYDAFAGVGGLAVHMAAGVERYWASDICADKIEKLRINASIYQVQEKIQAFAADFFEVKPFKVDLVILCPPWGGVNIDKYSSEPIDSIMSPSLTTILEHAVKFSDNFIIQMPKNVNLVNLMTIVLRLTGHHYCKLFMVNVNNKLSQLLVEVGPLFLERSLEIETFKRQLEGWEGHREGVKKVTSKGYKLYFQQFCRS